MGEGGGGGAVALHHVMRIFVVGWCAADALFVGVTLWTRISDPLILPVILINK